MVRVRRPCAQIEPDRRGRDEAAGARIFRRRGRCVCARSRGEGGVALPAAQAEHGSAVRGGETRGLSLLFRPEDAVKPEVTVDDHRQRQLICGCESDAFGRCSFSHLLHVEERLLYKSHAVGLALVRREVSQCRRRLERQRERKPVGLDRDCAQRARAAATDAHAAVVDLWLIRVRAAIARSRLRMSVPIVSAVLRVSAWVRGHAGVVIGGIEASFHVVSLGEQRSEGAPVALGRGGDALAHGADRRGQVVANSAEHEPHSGPS
mmetsp:Transcript_11073/g.23658  ORF Transcript_11073/g.23658 Transcript_11073/m.23658 type:complete len:264 (-) Transcript_11073:263-1054(-)